MPDQCPQDGGFIGDAGCSHPNHQHSELTESLMKSPVKEITPKECDHALNEGFYVDSKDGARVGFGKRLKEHIENGPKHTKDDVDNRKKRLLYAVDTVKTTAPKEVDHRRVKGRKLYTKEYKDFGMLVITDKRGVVDDAYTIFPRRSGRAK